MKDLKETKWISTKDELPDERKYVLGRYAGENWSDPDDNENVNVVVVKLLKGITLDERDLIAKGLCDTNHEENRHNIFYASDEYGNNKLPYEWRTFGPSSFFGQDITHWMPIIKL
jgi:hypothetical protein